MDKLEAITNKTSAIGSTQIRPRENELTYDIILQSTSLLTRMGWSTFALTCYGLLFD